jgi:hypothetical protein
LSTAFRADSLRPLFSVPSSFFNFFLKTCSSSSPQTGLISISHLKSRAFGMSYESQQYYPTTTVTTCNYTLFQGITELQMNDPTVFHCLRSQHRQMIPFSP